MAEYDVRSDEEGIDKIRFSDTEYITKEVGAHSITIHADDTGDSVEIFYRGIDDFIKALEKAKELWG